MTPVVFLTQQKEQLEIEIEILSEAEKRILGVQICHKMLTALGYKIVFE